MNESDLYHYLCDALRWGAPVALLATGALALLSAFLVRMAFYVAIRLTVRAHYTRKLQSGENLATVGMFFAGATVGYYLFGNYLSEVLCGVCWAFVMVGVVLQATTANEKRRRR